MTLVDWESQWVCSTGELLESYYQISRSGNTNSGGGGLSLLNRVFIENYLDCFALKCDSRYAKLTLCESNSHRYEFSVQFHTMKSSCSDRESRYLSRRRKRWTSRIKYQSLNIERWFAILSVWFWKQITVYRFRCWTFVKINKKSFVRYCGIVFSGCHPGATVAFFRWPLNAS